jgi:hypothetical protein
MQEQEIELAIARDADSRDSRNQQIFTIYLCLYITLYSKLTRKTPSPHSSRMWHLHAYCQENLRNDSDILLTAITADFAYAVLRSVSAELQCRHPAVTVKAIQFYDLHESRFFVTLVPDGLWRTHQPTAIAWIRRGFGVPEPLASKIRVRQKF